jgi:tripartite-type tricarboxylate transporter receptor subunit TctC
MFMSHEVIFSKSQKSRCCRAILWVVSFVVSLFAAPKGIFAQSDFYQGKTITYVVGLLAGDSTDLWSRSLTRQMTKHIPGQPQIIVQNMPGAGGLIAANYVYGVAKPDGLTMGSVSAAHYFHQLAGRKEAQFDWRKFSWIGSSARHEYLFVMRGDAPYKSLDDIRGASVAPKCSSTAPGSASYMTLKLLEEGLGLKFNIISGYKGGQEQDLALERGETQCRGVTTAAFLGRGPMQEWVKKGFLRVMLQTPPKRNPKLANVPTIYELMDRYRPSDAKRRVALVLLGGDNFGNFPTVGTAGIPPDRVKILRDAYAKALREPELLDEAKKRQWEVEHITAEELENSAREVIDQPADIIQRVKELLGGS